MPLPSYGAHPLSVTFLTVRIAQLTSIVVILGLTGNFINEMVMQNYQPSTEVIGTIAIASIVALYVLVTIPFYMSHANMGLYIMAGLDFMMLIAWIVVSVVIGKPISYLNCYFPGKTTDGHVLADILNNINKVGSTLTLQSWAGLDKSNCFETKAIWGFSIALAILFAMSTILLPTLRYKFQKVGGYTKTVV